MSSRRLLRFFALACAFSWALWLTAIASQRGLVPFRFSPGPLGSFGPAIAALLVARSDGPGRVRELLRRLVRYGGERRWLAFALLIPLLPLAAGIASHALAHGGLPAPAFDRLLWTPAAFLLILVLGGPLGEEPGWRGVVVPELLGRLSLVVTSLVVAAGWWVWHLPLFWMEGAAQEGSSIALFGVTVAALSVLFTWLYQRTAPSLVPSLLLHTSINVSSFGLPYVLPGVDESRAYSLAFVGVVVAIAIGVAVNDARAAGRRPPI